MNSVFVFYRWFLCFALKLEVLVLSVCPSGSSKLGCSRTRRPGTYQSFSTPVKKRRSIVSSTPDTFCLWNSSMDIVQQIKENSLLSDAHIAIGNGPSKMAQKLGSMEASGNVNFDARLVIILASNLHSTSLMYLSCVGESSSAM